MNTITKKYLIAGIVAVAVIATGSLALAVGIFPMPMVLQFGSSGNVLMRGTIDAVNTNSLTVKSWGGDWTVNITGSTRLMPQTSMAQFAVGDFVGIQGTVDQNSNWTVDATVVKDWAVRQIQNNTVNVLAPLISSLNPSSGSAGTTVTIHGSGFLSTNSIYLGNYIISENFIDSNTLSFTVPPSSQFIEGNCGAGLLCPGYVRSFPSGNYNVYVKNANGMSDEVAFTISNGSNLGLHGRQSL